MFGLGYVGGVSAAHHWDLTEQLFRTVFVYTTQVVRRTKQTIHGTRFSVHHIDPRLLFGTRPLWRGSIKIDVSDVHRTIIDMLSDPAIGGGARHIADCLAAYFGRNDADPKRLSSTEIDWRTARCSSGSASSVSAPARQHPSSTPACAG